MKLNNYFVWILILSFLGFGISTFNRCTNSKNPQEASNPYKNPEPFDSDSIATAVKSSAKEMAKEVFKEKVNTETGGGFDKIVEIIKEKTGFQKEGKNSNSNELPTWIFPKTRNSEEVVHHTKFSLGYNEEHEQAAWVAYILTAEQTEGTASRNGMEFIPDANVNTKSALTADYTGSGYDRGHLVPAGDFKCCRDLMKETFVMSNMSPQDQEFNRGIWGNLEIRVRSWARKEGKVYVITGPILHSKLQYIGRYNEVSVPEEYYKIVVKETSNGYEAIGFILENKPLIGSIIYDFVVTIDEIEKRTGLDFFSQMEKSQQSNLEKSASWVSFNKKAP